MRHNNAVLSTEYEALIRSLSQNLGTKSDIFPTIALETTNCPLCGGNSTLPVVEAPDFNGPSQSCFTVVRCRKCDLCYTNPRPSAADMGQFYDDQYAPHQKNTVFVKHPGAIKRFWRRIIGRIRPDWRHGEIERLGQCRLLDFGCGSGGFLHIMHQRGWRVWGLDVSERAIKHVRNELGLPALIGALPHGELSPGSFDLVTLWHSLEHVHRPLEILNEVYRLLVPGGKLLVAAPNIDSASFRWFGPAWYGLDLPRHLTHFTPKTLKKMLHRAGFVFEAMQMARQSNLLRESALRACLRGEVWPPRRLLQYHLPSSFISRCNLLAGRADIFMVMARKPHKKI